MNTVIYFGKAIQSVADASGSDYASLADQINGMAGIFDTCHLLASNAGWWNRRAPALPEPAKTRVIEAMESAGLPIGQRLTAEEIIAMAPEKLCLTHSELSEGMEGHRKGLMDDKLTHRPALEVEMADAVIRIADFCKAMNLDLSGAIIEKLAFNLHRPDHKPESRAAAGGKTY